MSAVPDQIEKVLVATVALMVARDAMTILPCMVPVYEAEVSKAVFGEDNVTVEGDGDPVAIEPAAEAERLVRRFGEEAVVNAFGTNYKGAVAAAVANAAKQAADQAAASQNGPDAVATGKTARGSKQ